MSRCCNSTACGIQETWPASATRPWSFAGASLFLRCVMPRGPKGERRAALVTSGRASRPARVMRRAAAAETASSGLRSQGYRHRQTQILRSGASRNWLLWNCTSKDCVPTIERRILISRFDDANERCKVSYQASDASTVPDRSA